jgi:elongation factor 2
MRVNLVDFELNSDVVLGGSVEVMRGIGKAVFGSFLTAKPALLEPFYRVDISVPPELAADCQRIIKARRGKVSCFENKGLLTIITGHIPVEESFGLSKELRTSTSGRAFWQSSLDRWERVPERVAVKVIAEVRGRKGLASEVPLESVFVEEGER